MSHNKSTWLRTWLSGYFMRWYGTTCDLVTRPKIQMMLLLVDICKIEQKENKHITAPSNMSPPQLGQFLVPERLKLRNWKGDCIQLSPEISYWISIFCWKRPFSVSRSTMFGQNLTKPLWSSEVRAAEMFAAEAASCPQVDRKPGATALLRGSFHLHWEREKCHTHLYHPSLMSRTCQLLKPVGHHATLHGTTCQHMFTSDKTMYSLGAFTSAEGVESWVCSGLSWKHASLRSTYHLNSSGMFEKNK